MGGVPYFILEPVLKKATPKQLLTIEDYNAVSYSAGVSRVSSLVISCLTSWELSTQDGSCPNINTDK